MRRKTTQRRGTILFEVVVGLAILAIAGIGWITLLAQTRASIAALRVREARARAAGDLLQRYRFLTEREFEARIGTMRSGTLAISISRSAPHLFVLAALDSAAHATILATTVYARDTTDVGR